MEATLSRDRAVRAHATINRGRTSGPEETINDRQQSPAEGDAMLVMPSQKTRPRWVTRGINSLVGAAMFIAPLLVLVIV
jgi:hypothetical protein